MKKEFEENIVDKEKEVCVCCKRPLDEQFKRTGIFKDVKSLPELPRMIEVAKQCGYALIQHGSMTRDIDLLAVPWVEGAVTPKGLIRMLCSVNPNKIFVEEHQKITEKPFGRLCQVIYIAGADTYIDLSICSTFGSTNPTQDALVKALEAARQFIENGIELGFIRMPDEYSTDSALDTLPMIKKALSTIKKEGGKV